MKDKNRLDFFRNGFNGHHEWWRYLAGTLIIFIIWQIGSIPLIFAAFYKKAKNEGLKMLEMTDPSDIMNVLSPNLTFFLLLLSFVFGLAAVYFMIRVLHQQNVLSSLTARSKFDWGRSLFAFTLIAVLTIIATLVDYKLNPSHYEVSFQWQSFLILAVIAVAMVPLQTTFEEWFFRGYLMQGFGYIFKNRAVPFIVTSLFFGLLHIGNPEVEKLGYIVMVNYVGVGFFLGILTLMDEGLELAAGFHAANNLITALLVTAEWTAFSTPSILKDVSEPEVGFDVLIPVLVVYPIIVIVLAKRYQWTNWRQKLFGKVKLNDDFTNNLQEN